MRSVKKKQQYKKEIIPVFVGKSETIMKPKMDRSSGTLKYLQGEIV